MFTDCSTWLNWTSCVVNWVASIGDSGSWCCNWVVSSSRKRSKSPAIDPLPGVAVGVAAGAVFEAGAAGGDTVVIFPSPRRADRRRSGRSEEHTSELQSLMRISYAVFCLKKKTKSNVHHHRHMNITPPSH